jgi:glutamate/tyrosine decarboxylase-like PLP-dependent enzyme
VSSYDQNVQVHLPQSTSTHVERHTIGMLCDLLSLKGFDGTITTGATAGNILGLACGREHQTIINTTKKASEAGASPCEVITAGAHSSVQKAASILGIGRKHCRDASDYVFPDRRSNFELGDLSSFIEHNAYGNVGNIIVATFGEVDTGEFPDDMEEVAEAVHFRAGWLHIDAAFGVLARIHPQKENLARFLELADSISFDGHKFFNVPYDCGVFLTKHMEILQDVCGNIGAPYLGTSDEISPLNISLENSRRFRALPLYASLVSLGKQGYVDLVVRCCNLAMAMGERIKRSSSFELLHEVKFNIVLLQAKNYASVAENEKVKGAINATGKLYLSETKSHKGGKPFGALRLAVCNHLTPADAETEASQIMEILENVIKSLNSADT